MLDQLLRGDPQDRLLVAARGRGPVLLRHLVGAAEIDLESAIELGRALVAAGRMRELRPGVSSGSGDDLVVDAEGWRELTERTRRMLREYHAAFPLRSGMPREELKSKLGLDSRALGACLLAWVDEGVVREAAGAVGLAEYRPTPTNDEQAAIDRMLARVTVARFAPPSAKDLVDQVGEEAFAFLIASGALVAVSADVVFGGEAYAALVAGVQGLLARDGQATVAKIRDEFGTSRKYIVGLLEHLDAQGITVRAGDLRKLGPGSRKS
jgi:selenocysteine-specific elongation factor